MDATDLSLNPVPTDDFYATDLSLNPVPLPPAPITIDDLLNSVEIVKQKETEDKVLLEGIGTISHEQLKTKLLAWASAGFPNAYEVHRVTINPPAQCSDGVVRGLSDYIVYCSGKTMPEHVAVLQSKVTGMAISFANMGGYIAIVVSKD
jgi:hypothetical protein